MGKTIQEKLDSILRTIAQYFAMKGSAMEVAILAHSKVCLEENYYDNWNGGTDYYTLKLQINISLYTQIEDKLDILQNNIMEKINSLVSSTDRQIICEVAIIPELEDDKNWRDKAKAWLCDKNISNQGRVRSDNVAPKNCDGLLFRSNQEIFLYKELKTRGISFAPLPVFIRGGLKYKRIEPDFVIIKDGIFMVVEVDGDTVHHETPAEADSRTSILEYEGAKVIHVTAKECESAEEARKCATKIIKILEKLKLSRG